MKKNINQLDNIGNKNPFKTPDGYFDNLTSQIMSQLPEKVESEQHVLSLWERMKPWAYMAAMFMGIALMVKLFVGSPAQSSSELKLTSGAEMEEFFQYYENQLANSFYHEAVYLGELDSYESFE